MSWCYNTTFNNILVISWWSVLLVEETGVLRENHWPAAVTDKLYHITLYRVNLVSVGFKLTALVVIGTDCISSCKSNYHMITTTTTPFHNLKIPYYTNDFVRSLMSCRSSFTVNVFMCLTSMRFLRSVILMPANLTARSLVPFRDKPLPMI